MDALADSYPGVVVSRDDSLEREFEQRLADSSTLAFRVALAVLRNRADAEEVAQEAFLRAYQNFRHLRDRQRFRPWLVRITWRLALDRHRAARRRDLRTQAVHVTPPESTAEDLAASSEFQHHLQNAVAELPEKLRIVLLLAAVEGYEMEEVAALLGLPLGTVKSRLFWARKKLAEKLQWLVSGTKTR